MRTSNGKALAHAELKTGGFQTKLADEFGETKNSSPTFLCVSLIKPFLCCLLKKNFNHALQKGKNHCIVEDRFCENKCYSNTQVESKSH